MLFNNGSYSYSQANQANRDDQRIQQIRNILQGMNARELTIAAQIVLEEASRQGLVIEVPANLENSIIFTNQKEDIKHNSLKHEAKHERSL